MGVWDPLVTENNRHAVQTMQNGTHVHPRPWSDIEVVEMKAFVGILMLMGICRLPRLEMYWSTQQHFFSSWHLGVMTKTRFQQIFRFLHLPDYQQYMRGVDRGDRAAQAISSNSQD